jgi:hypothetical protein
MTNGTPMLCCFVEADGVTRCDRPGRYMLEITGKNIDALACTYHYGTGYVPALDTIH